MGFQWNVEHLKEVKSRLDLEILKKADVIGMTTTGKSGEGAPNFYVPTSFPGTFPWLGGEEIKKIPGTLGTRLSTYLFTLGMVLHV